MEQLNASQPSSGTATPRSKLDTLPREELVRFAKKQYLSVQKARERISSLERDLADCQRQAADKEAESSASEQEDEVARLTSRCGALEAELTSKCDDLARLRVDVDERRRRPSAEADTVQEECQLLRRALTERGVVCERLNDENERLADEVESLRSEMSSVHATTAQSAPDTSSVDVGLLCQLPSPAEHLLAAANEAAEQAARQRDVLTSTVQQLTQELTAEREAVECMAKKYNHQLEKGDLLDDKLRLAEEESAKLRADFAQLQDAPQRQDVLSLEMADYERSLAQMKTEVDEAKANNLSRDAELGQLRQQLDSTTANLAKSEASVGKLKAALVKFKKDLAAAVSKKQECLEDAERLQTQLNQVTDQLESLKLEMATSAADARTRTERLETTSASASRRLESETERRVLAEQQLATVSGEFDAYKVRVHTVLKQRHADNEAEEKSNECERLRQTVEELNLKLSEARSLVVAAKEELASCQDEQERFAAKSRATESAMLERSNALNQQLELQRVAYEHKLKAADDRLTALRAELQVLEQAHKSRVSEMRSTQESEVLALKERVGQLELQRQLSVDACEPLDAMPPPPPPPHFERRPAEGSESCEPPLNGAALGRGSPVFGDYAPSMGVNVMSPSASIPLEDLICSDARSQSSLVGGRVRKRRPLEGTCSTVVTEASADVQEALRRQRAEAARRIEHLSELLSESEAAHARLLEQSKLLKEEVRRLERNEQRSPHAANTEYLKNVVMQFLSPQVSAEREQLVPVLQTMLRLSPQEVSLLRSTASGTSETQSSMESSWSNYLHRWTGLT